MKYFIFRLIPTLEFTWMLHFSVDLTFILFLTFALTVLILLEFLWAQVLINLKKLQFHYSLEQFQFTSFGM